MKLLDIGASLGLFAERHPFLSYISVLVIAPVVMVFGLICSTSLIAAPISLLLGWII